MSSGTRTGMYHSIPKDREQEENDKKAFLKFWNGKGKKKVPKIWEWKGNEKSVPKIWEQEGNEKSVPKIWEREENEKNPFPQFGNGKGMKKKHSRNSGMGRE